MFMCVSYILTSYRRRGNIKDQRMANFQDFHSLANERVNQFYEIDLEQREHTASDPE